MILSVDPAVLFALLATAGYLLALLPTATSVRWPERALVAAGILHFIQLVLVLKVGDGQGLRFGFAPVLSFTVWLVLLVHAVECRFVPVPRLRRVLALCGTLAVLLAWVWPGEVRALPVSPWAPVHWMLGLTSYGLFGAAVLHALMLDSAEQRMRRRDAGSSGSFGIPLLRLERLTFRFVDGGFLVLTLALLIGLSEPSWRWADHKTVLSLLGWATFAALIVGRYRQGWRGRQATRWLYVGTLLLLLAYVGSRFVMEVLLRRPVG